MTAQRFAGLSNEELSDIWYALGGAETRHPGGFSDLVDAAFNELNTRLTSTLTPYLEERFRKYRLADSKEDAAASARAAVESGQER